MLLTVENQEHKKWLANNNFSLALEWILGTEQKCVILTAVS
jgi:hypothetical protein